MTSETTPVLGLQLTAAGQAMKHVTVNEALLRLDALVHLAVKERSRNTPPLSPVAGDRYLVGAAPTGTFAGHTGAVASFDAGIWTFMTPGAGWRAYIAAESVMLVFDGTNWVGFSGAGSITELQSLTLLGLGTTADAINPLSIKANNALFSAASTPSGTGDLRFKLNKDTTANTLSQLYQTGYSGRAETGLIGNDRYGVKVSADGAAWKTALEVDGATGVVSLPQGVLGAPAGFRNRIINGAFGVNQRGVSGTVTLASGAIGHDRWKAGAAGCTYTFSTSGTDKLITISAGTLLQVIEDLHVPEGGVYRLGWSGNANARVYQGSPSGSYASGPLQTGTLTAATHTTVEFSTGSVTRVQFEPGTIATVFERRNFSQEVIFCQRYFCKTFPYAVAPAQNAGYPGSLYTYPAGANTAFGLSWRLPVQMRVAPTCIGYNPVSTNANWSAGGAAIFFGALLNPTCDSVPLLCATTPTIAVGSISAAHATADAEL